MLWVDRKRGPNSYNRIINHRLLISRNGIGNTSRVHVDHPINWGYNTAMCFTKRLVGLGFIRVGLGLI